MGRKDEARFVQWFQSPWGLLSIRIWFSANQFRALEEDEIMFLDSIRERQEDEERQRKEKDGVEVMDFKKYASYSVRKPYLKPLWFLRAVAARENATNHPPPPVLSAGASIPTIASSDNSKSKSVPAKKDIKKSLKGVLVKKKPKVPADPAALAIKEKRSVDGESKADSDSERDAKRRRVEPKSKILIHD